MSAFNAYYVGLKFPSLAVSTAYPAMLLELLNAIQVDFGRDPADCLRKNLERPPTVNRGVNENANLHHHSREQNACITNEFQIGLTLSGGATCGAYSAGVMDFLFEALSEWEKAIQQGHQKLPPWTVRIRNMVGSSAGAIVTTLAAASITAFHEPLPKAFRLGDTPLENNILYRGWVSDFGRGIFETSDLPLPDATTSKVIPIRSIFNSSFLRKQPDLLCENQSTHQPIPNWAKDIQVYLAVTNVQGVPYSFSFDNSLDPESTTYHMLNHSDSVGFSTASDPDPTSFPLNLRNNRNCEDWQTLFDVAGASAAIPAVFPAVLLSRPTRHYHKLTQSTTPRLPNNVDNPYSFHGTDGGILNNEPVNISRDALQQVATKCGLDTSGSKSWGALIMIDCNGKSSADVRPATASATPLSMLHCIVSTMLSIFGQATLKHNELNATNDGCNFSQYLISPIREGRKPNQTMLATGTLYGFGGMIDERIRHHDFVLGRRNCQQFLREQFRVEVDGALRNPVFGGVDSYADGREKVQIIPLVGTAANECPMPTWPAYSPSEQDAIARRMSAKVYERLLAVFMTFARNMGLVGEGRWWNRVWSLQQSAVRQVVKLLALVATKKIERFVVAALEQFR